MARTYNRVITIQKINEQTEKWTDLYTIHAYVNKTREDNEFVSANAIQTKRYLTFEVRYFSGLEPISLNTQKYRVVFEGHPYNLTSFDDYLMQHRYVSLVGESV